MSGVDPARLRFSAYLSELDGFYGDDEQPDDVLDRADGGHESAALHLSDIRALIGEVETLRAKVAAVEALAEESTERAYFGIAVEKMLTIQCTSPGRAQVPGHWREAAEFAAVVPVAVIRAALDTTTESEERA